VSAPGAGLARGLTWTSVRPLTRLLVIFDLADDLADAIRLYADARGLQINESYRSTVGIARK
jgi:hypothetical protein